MYSFCVRTFVQVFEKIWINLSRHVWYPWNIKWDVALPSMNCLFKWNLAPGQNVFPCFISRCRMAFPFAGFKLQLGLPSPTRWVKCGQGPNKKAAGRRRPDIPPWRLLCSSLIGQHPPTQQNIFIFGFSFKTVNRWLWVSWNNTFI